MHQPTTSTDISAKAALHKQKFDAKRLEEKEEDRAWNSAEQKREWQRVQREQAVIARITHPQSSPAPTSSLLPAELVIERCQYYWHQRASQLFRGIQRMVAPTFFQPRREVPTFECPVSATPQKDVPAPVSVEKQTHRTSFPAWLNDLVPPLQEEVCEDEDATSPRLPAVKVSTPPLPLPALDIAAIPTKDIALSPEQKARLAAVEQEREPAMRRIEVHGGHDTIEALEKLLDCTSLLYLDRFGEPPDQYALSNMDGLAIYARHGRTYKGRLIEIDPRLVSGVARAVGKASPPSDECGE